MQTSAAELHHRLQVVEPSPNLTGVSKRSRPVTRLDQLSWHPSLFKVAASAAAEACFYFWTLMEVIQSYFTLWFGGLVGVTGL